MILKQFDRPVFKAWPAHLKAGLMGVYQLHHNGPRRHTVFLILTLKKTSMGISPNIIGPFSTYMNNTVLALKSLSEPEMTLTSNDLSVAAIDCSMVL